MVTLDYSHLTSVLWGPAGQGGSLAGAAGAEEQVNMEALTREAA